VCIGVRGYSTGGSGMLEEAARAKRVRRGSAAWSAGVGKPWSLARRLYALDLCGRRRASVLARVRGREARMRAGGMAASRPWPRQRRGLRGSGAPGLRDSVSPLLRCSCVPVFRCGASRGSFGGCGTRSTAQNATERSPSTSSAKRHSTAGNGRSAGRRGRPSMRRSPPHRSCCNGQRHRGQARIGERQRNRSGFDVVQRHPPDPTRVR